MNWREQCKDKLMSPAETVKPIKSGDKVMVAPFTCTPYTLCEALFRRKDELEQIRIDHAVSLFPWLQPGGEEVFEVWDNFASPVTREAVNAGQISYVPVGHWHSHTVPDGFVAEPDYYLVPISPPDRHGYCSFGPGVWMSGTFCSQAKTVIAEVHENFIRTGGENYVHISQIDRMCEAARATGVVPLPPRTDEEIAVTEVICTLVASELVKDRDTLQIGIGTVSSAMALYVHDKHDLGIQTEMIPGGVADLVQEGVVTGRYKQLHPGKVVGSVFVALPEEELALIDGNPVFELYDFGHTDDLSLLIQEENYVAINNVLLVDLTGQLTAEYIGPRVWSGVGGQTVFCIAAAYSKGGRSISVTPSTSLVDGQRRSRIMPALPEATVVTVPRTFVDYVVTEYGIATLKGKTVRQRIDELISVAHPDFQAELRKEAKRLYAL